MHNKHKIAVTLAYLVLLTAISVNLFVLQYGDYDLVGKGYFSVGCEPLLDIGTNDLNLNLDTTWDDLDTSITKICAGSYELTTPIPLGDPALFSAFVCEEDVVITLHPDSLLPKISAIIITGNNVHIEGCTFEGFGDVDDGTKAAITDDVLVNDGYYNIDIFGNYFINNVKSIVLHNVQAIGAFVTVTVNGNDFLVDEGFLVENNNKFSLAVWLDKFDGKVWLEDNDFENSGVALHGKAGSGAKVDIFLQNTFTNNLLDLPVDFLDATYFSFMNIISATIEGNSFEKTINGIHSMFSSSVEINNNFFSAFDGGISELNYPLAVHFFNHNLDPLSVSYLKENNFINFGVALDLQGASRINFEENVFEDNDLVLNAYSGEGINFLKNDFRGNKGVTHESLIDVPQWFTQEIFIYVNDFLSGGFIDNKFDEDEEKIIFLKDSQNVSFYNASQEIVSVYDGPDPNAAEVYSAHFLYPARLDVLRKYTFESNDVDEDLTGALVTFWEENNDDGIYDAGEKVVLQYVVGEKPWGPYYDSPYFYSFRKMGDVDGGFIVDDTKKTYAYKVEYGRDFGGNRVNLLQEPIVIDTPTSNLELGQVIFEENCVSPLDIDAPVYGTYVFRDYDPENPVEPVCGLMGDSDENGIIEAQDLSLLEDADAQPGGFLNENLPCGNLDTDLPSLIITQDDVTEFTNSFPDLLLFPNLVLSNDITFCEGMYEIQDNDNANPNDNINGVISFNVDSVTVECEGTIFSGELFGQPFFSSDSVGVHITNNNIAVKGCEFRNYDFGAFISNAENVEMSDNIFLSGSYGIYAENSLATIKYNQFMEHNYYNLRFTFPNPTDVSYIFGNLFYNRVLELDLGFPLESEDIVFIENLDLPLEEESVFLHKDGKGNYWENYEDVVGEACVDAYTNYKLVYTEADLGSDGFCDKSYDIKVDDFYLLKDEYPYVSAEISASETASIEATTQLFFITPVLKAATSFLTPEMDSLTESLTYNWFVDEDIFDDVSEFKSLTAVNIPMNTVNEAKGFGLIDISENSVVAFAGKLDGSGEHSPTIIKEGIGYSAQFGPDDYIIIKNHEFMPTDKFTIEFLAKIKSQQNGQLFARLGYSGFRVLYEDDNIVLHVKAFGQEETFIIKENVAPDFIGNFHYFAFTFRKVSSKILVDVYIDDELISLDNIPASYFPCFVNNNDWFLGGDLGGTIDSIYGVIDEFKIYNRILTEQQIAENYALYFDLGDIVPHETSMRIMYEEHETCGAWKVKAHLTTETGDVITLDTLEAIYDDPNFMCGYEECVDDIDCVEPKICIEKIPAVEDVFAPIPAVKVCDYKTCIETDENLGDGSGAPVDIPCPVGQTCMEGKCMICTPLTNGMQITEDTLLCGETYEITTGISIVEDDVQLICSDDTEIIGDGTDSGVYLGGVVGAQVINCDISNFEKGIALENCDGCYLGNNYIHDNLIFGIWTEEGIKDMIIENNLIENNDFGLAVSDTSESTFTYDSIDIQDSVFTKNQFNFFTYGLSPKIRFYDSVLNESKIHLDFSSTLIDFSLLNKEYGDILFAIESDPLDVPEFDFYNTDFDDVMFFGTDVLDLSDVEIEISLGDDDAQSVLDILETVETAPGGALALCLALTNVTVNDYCVKELAFTTETSAYCANIINSAQKDHCNVYFVFNDEDYTLCSNVVDPIIETKCEALEFEDLKNRNAILNRYWGLDVYVVKPDGMIVEQAAVEITHYDAVNDDYILLDTDGDGFVNMGDVVYTNSEGVVSLWLLANITDKNQAEAIKDDNPYRITVSEGTVSPEPAFSETFTIKEQMFKQIDLIAGVEVNLVAAVSSYVEEQTQTGGGGNPNNGPSCAPKFDASCSLKHKTTACVKQGGLNYSTRIFTCTSTNGCGTKLIVDKCDGNAPSFAVGCDNKIKDIGEEGIDCGGPCQDICPSTCSDFKKNQDETDIDCGGMKCPQCNDNKNCDLDSDCLSGYCDGVCKQPTCHDGVMNQDETDVDCGGSCGDCGIKEATCFDDIKNQDEEEVDCGGSCSVCVEPIPQSPIKFNYYWFLLLLIPLIGGLLFVGLKSHKTVPKTDVLQPLGIPKKIPSPETITANVVTKEVVLDRKLITEVKQKLSSGKSKAQIIKESKHSKQEIEQLFKVGVSFILPDKYNKDLKKYINHYYAKGMSKKAIASNLIKKGWNKELVGGVLYPSSVKVTFKGSTELPEEVAAQLKKYVAHYRKKGMANALIKKNLIKVGWKKELIEKILK